MPKRGGCRQGAGRKANWQYGETQTIRVPVALKEDLLEIGKQLDQGQQVYSGKAWVELEEIIREWKAKSQENDSEEWQLVRQLIGEIETALSERMGRVCRKGRHGQGNGHCHQNEERRGRHGQGRCHDQEDELATNSLS
jgi:hypothetical protein